MERRLALACFAFVAACGSGSAPGPAPATPVVSVAAVPPGAATEPSEPSEPGTPRAADSRESGSPELSLSAADCRAFQQAEALAVALVVSIAADCSGIGNVRMVLEVHELTRGDGIDHLELTRTLGVSHEPSIELGDTLVVAIDPEDRPAETVDCVPLPARQGVVSHFEKVDSFAAGVDLLAELAERPDC